jgi:hypothetical protein
MTFHRMNVTQPHQLSAFTVAFENLPLPRVAHDDCVVLLQQSFVKTLFVRVVRKRYPLFGGVLVGYGQDYTCYVHAILLHPVRPVAERIVV